MKIRLVSCGIAAAVMAGALSFLALSAPAAQYAAKDKDLADVPKDPRYEKDPEKKVTPRTPDGHVDFTGFWIDYYTDPVGDTVEYSKLNNSKLYNDYDDTPRYGSKYEQDVSGSGFPIPYKPQYLARVKATADKTFETLNPDDPYLQCKPLGITRLNRGGHHNGFQMIENSKFIAILYEEAPGPVFRTIYMDWPTASRRTSTLLTKAIRSATGMATRWWLTSPASTTKPCSTKSSTRVPRLGCCCRTATKST